MNKPRRSVPKVWTIDVFPGEGRRVAGSLTHTRTVHENLWVADERGLRFLTPGGVPTIVERAVRKAVGRELARRTQQAIA
jgi:hypothetical protein